MLWKSKLALAALVGLTLIGCGDDATGDGSPSNGTQNNAEDGTDCGGCEEGNYCDTESSTCKSGCLDSTDCASEDFCQKEIPPEVGDVGYCTSREQAAQEVEDCHDAVQVLVDCGAVEEDFFDPCQQDPDAGGFLYEDSGCVLSWSDGTSCPATLPDCLLYNEIECGPNYPCPDGQECTGGPNAGYCG